MPLRGFLVIAVIISQADLQGQSPRTLPTELLKPGVAPFGDGVPKEIANGRFQSIRSSPLDGENLLLQTGVVKRPALTLTSQRQRGASRLNSVGVDGCGPQRVVTATFRILYGFVSSKSAPGGLCIGT
jgi:hypothetical protein